MPPNQADLFEVYVYQTVSVSVSIFDSTIFLQYESIKTSPAAVVTLD